MSRWRVIEVVCDSSFGYAPAPMVDVVKDWLTRAEAKCIYNHYCKKQIEAAKRGDTLWLNTVDYMVEVLGDEGEWHAVSNIWAYDGEGLQAQWFEDRGWNYMAWCAGYNFK